MSFEKNLEHLMSNIMPPQTPYPGSAVAGRVPEMWRILIRVFVAGLFRTAIRVVDKKQCSGSLFRVQ